MCSGEIPVTEANPWPDFFRNREKEGAFVPTDTIFIESIEFYAYHGASDEEQAVGHRYSVDVELRFDTRRAGDTDDLSKTVNYAEVAARIVEVGTGERRRLIEAVAQRMADPLLAEPAVES